MLSSKEKASFLCQMSSICQNHSSLKAQITHTSLFGSQDKILYEKSLLALEYLQLLSPILFIISFSFQSSQEEFLPKTLLFLAKLLNPAYWVSFAELDDFKITILAFVFLAIAFKATLLVFIAHRLYKRASVPGLLIKIWRNLFKAHGRIICFYLTSLLVDTVTKGKRDEETVNNAIMSIFAFFTFTEFIFAMFLNLRYVNILPTKSFLSSKNPTAEAITLLQKFIIQMMMIFVDLESLRGIWSFTVINVIADLVRNLYFFKRFPLYNFKAMAFQGRFLMVLTSLNIAGLVACVTRSVNEEKVSLKLVIILWVILTIFLMKLAEEFLQQGFWSIISNPKITDPYLLIHRISAIKQLRKITRKPSESTENFTWTLLANKTLNNENLLKEVLKIDSKFEITEPLDINSRDCSTLMFKYYLERLVEIYPENQIIQLFLAQYYVKKIKVYGDAIKICKAIQAKGHINMVLNAELLLIDIQSTIQQNSSKENNPESPFDTVSYIQQQSLLAKLKLQMLDQAKFQIKIYNEIKKETPNLALIFNNSQALNSLKNRISHKTKNLLEEISEYHIEPYLLYAHYHRALNHSFNDYTHFLDLYLNKNQRCQKYFNQEGLSQKNMFQDNVGFYFLSGQAADAGNILFTSKSGVRGLKDVDMLIGTNISERGPPCLRPIYAEFYKTLAENTPDTYFNPFS